MRRWLILFLLTVLPLQFASAAIAGYCSHEADVAAKHVGHHDHEHDSASGKTATKPVDGKKAERSAGLDDPDCGYCHLGGAQLLMQDFSPPGSLLDSRPRMQEVLFFGTRDPDALDRPNWTLLA